MILINDIALNIGARQKVFPSNELVQHVYPLLKTAEYLSNSQMQWLLIKKKKTYFAGLIAISVGLIGVLTYFTFNTL